MCFEWKNAQLWAKKCQLVRSPSQSILIFDEILSLNIGMRPLFLKWRFYTNHNLLRKGTATAIQSNGEKLCWWRGSNSRPCVPWWWTAVMAAFFQRIPGKVAVWYDHPKSRPVMSGCHCMVNCDPDQDSGLFWSKQHRPTAGLTARCYRAMYEGSIWRQSTLVTLISL